MATKNVMRKTKSIRFAIPAALPRTSRMSFRVTGSANTILYARSIWKTPSHEYARECRIGVIRMTVVIAAKPRSNKLRQLQWNRRQLAPNRMAISMSSRPVTITSDTLMSVSRDRDMVALRRH